MTGYESKRAAAQDKLAQPAQEREALKLALEVLALAGGNLCEALHHPKKYQHGIGEPCPAVAKYDKAIAAIKEALALTSTKCEVQPAQEPVAKYSDIVSDGGLDPRNTTPPQRTWVGLTDEEINTAWKKWIGTERANKSYTLAIEDTLRSKNT